MPLAKRIHHHGLNRARPYQHAEVGAFAESHCRVGRLRSAYRIHIDGVLCAEGWQRMSETLQIAFLNEQIRWVEIETDAYVQCSTDTIASLTLFRLTLA